MFASTTTTKRTESVTPSSSQRMTGKTVLVRSDDPYKKPLAVLANHFTTDVSYSKKVTIEEVTTTLKSKGFPTRSFGRGSGGSGGGSANPYVTTAKNLGNKRNPKAPVWIVQDNDGLKAALKAALGAKTHRGGLKPVLMTPRTMKLPAAMEKLFGNIIPLDTLPGKLEALRGQPRLQKASLPAREKFLARPQGSQSQGNKPLALRGGQKEALPEAAKLSSGIQNDPLRGTLQTGNTVAQSLDHQHADALSTENLLSNASPLYGDTLEQGGQGLFRGRQLRKRKRSQEQEQGLEKAQALVKTLEASGVHGVLAESHKELKQLSKLLQQEGFKQESPLHYSRIAADGSVSHTVIVPVSEKGKLPYQPDYDSAIEAAEADRQAYEIALEEEFTPEEALLAIEVNEQEAYDTETYGAESYGAESYGTEALDTEPLDYTEYVEQEVDTTDTLSIADYYDPEELARYEREVDQYLASQEGFDGIAEALELEGFTLEAAEESEAELLAIEETAVAQADTINLADESFAASNTPEELAPVANKDKDSRDRNTLELETEREDELLSLEDFSFPDRANTPRLYLADQSSTDRDNQHTKARQLKESALAAA